MPTDAAKYIHISVHAIADWLDAQADEIKRQSKYYDETKADKRNSRRHATLYREIADRVRKDGIDIVRKPRKPTPPMETT